MGSAENVLLFIEKLIHHSKTTIALVIYLFFQRLAIIHLWKAINRYRPPSTKTLPEVLLLYKERNKSLNKGTDTGIPYGHWNTLRRLEYHTETGIPYGHWNTL
jgi:hypothetical protein